MSIAIAIAGSASRSPQRQLKASRLRLLPADKVAPHAHKPPPQPGTEAFGWRPTIGVTVLALAVHAYIAWFVLTQTERPRPPKVSQEMTLLKLPLEVRPEPPKPEPSPPRKVDPPKAVKAPQQTPAPSLRTPPAQGPQVDTLTVAENLTAPASTGPVVATAPVLLPEPKVEEPVTEANGAAAYLNNPPPSYPKAAQRLGLEGRVLLRVQVLANGQVGAIEVKQSSGKPVLDEAALAAVKAWVFTPSKRGKTPITGWTHVPIEFRIAS